MCLCVVLQIKFHHVVRVSLQVVVTFFSDGKFEVIPALTTITANEIVEAQEIMFHRDLRGMGNPGVFLKNTDSQDGKYLCRCGR